MTDQEDAESDSTTLPSFHDIQQLYERAEQRIKQTHDSASEEASIPAINELRYAGNHILRAETLDRQTPEQDKAYWEELRRARNHCQRAIFEACDLAILDRLEVFAQFENDYRKVVITEVVSDYADRILPKIQEIREFVNDAPYGKDKSVYCDQLDNYLQDLVPIIRKLEFSRNELNKKLNRNRFNVQTTLAVIALSIVGIFVTYLVSLW